VVNSGVAMFGICVLRLELVVGVKKLGGAGEVGCQNFEVEDKLRRSLP
jgi:hypothetical protein